MENSHKGINQPISLEYRLFPLRLTSFQIITESEKLIYCDMEARGGVWILWFSERCTLTRVLRTVCC